MISCQGLSGAIPFYVIVALGLSFMSVAGCGPDLLAGSKLAKGPAYLRSYAEAGS